jgi:hypothetical protein
VNVDWFSPAFTPLKKKKKTGEIPAFVAKAVNVTGLPSQTGFADAVIFIPAGIVELTDMITVLEMAGFPVAQLKSETTMQEIVSPSDGLKVNTGLLDPTLIPLTIHRWVGRLPPLTTVDEYITGCPVHTGFADGCMVTLTGRSVLTVMAIGADWAMEALTQEALDDISQSTLSPLAGI